MEVERANSDALVVNSLPDGSRVIVDSGNERVLALNATAGAAWDACSGPTTLSEVAQAMQRTLDPRVTEELAAEAIQQLQEKNLVKTAGVLPNRRQFIATMGAVALPLVASLQMTEQRAYASQARSAAAPPSSPPPSSPPPNGGHGILWWILHLLGLV